MTYFVNWRVIIRDPASPQVQQQEALLQKAEIHRTDCVITKKKMSFFFFSLQAIAWLCVVKTHNAAFNKPT